MRQIFSSLDTDNISTFHAKKFPDLAVWLDASDLSTITKNGSNLISQWADKSGNNNHATQLVGANQPLFTSSSSQNYMPAIHSIANDMLTIADSPTLNYNECSIFMVHNLIAGSGNFSYALWKWSGSGNYEFILTGMNDTISASRLFTSSNGTTIDGIIDGPTPRNNGTTSLLELQYSGTEINFLTSGTPQGTDTTPGTIHNGGADLTIFNGAASIIQETQEILIFTSELSTEQKQHVRNYLIQKWRII